MASNSYTRRINLFINGKEVKSDLVSVRSEMRKLINEQARMTIGSREYNLHAQKIKGLKGIIQEHNEQLRVTNKRWLSLSGMANKFNKYFGMATAFIASATGVVLGAKKIIESNADLSDSFADVSKTTNLTTEEVKDLYKQLKQVDTRTANRELLGLATIAGKLGVEGKENVLGFVRAADQINVALAEDLGGNAEEAIRQVGKLVDIFKLKDTYGLEQGMLKVGSAVNALGAASTANEGYLVEFTKRVAGIAPSAGISIEKVLGLAATLDQLGQTSEVSSTVFSQVIPMMFKDTATFANIANMSVDDFSKLLNEDANEAMLKFLEGLNGNNEGLAVMTQKLDELGLEGKRSTAVLGVLANNTDLVREQQALANDEFAKGTSLTNEFEKKNTNLAATLDKLRKRFAGIFINSGMLNGLQKFVDWIDRVTKTSINETVDRERKSVNRLVMELTDSNTKEGERQKILEKLEKINKKIVKGLNAENIEVVKLKDNLRLYNEELSNRIILANLEKEEEKEASKLAAARTKLADKQISASEYMSEAVEWQRTVNKELSSQMSDILLSEDSVANKLVKFKGLVDETFGKGSFSSATLRGYINALDKLQNKLDVQEKKSIDFTKRTEEFKKILGLNAERSDPNNTPSGEVGGGGKDTNYVNEETRKAREELNKILAKLREDDRLAKMEDDERELELIRIRFDKELEVYRTALENEQITKAEFDGYQDEINLLRDDALNAKKAEQNERDKEDEAAHQAALFAIKKEYGILTEEEIIDAEIAAIKNKQEWEKLSEIEKEKVIAAIRKKALKDTELTEEQKKEMIINSIQSTLGTAASLFKEHTVAYKALASAETLVNTYKSATASYASMASIPVVGPALGFAAAATAVAAGLKNVAEINKVKGFADGRYDVIGANDNRFYPNVPFIGPVSGTGIVHGTSLISEKGDEMIINAEHLRNLQANYPEILNAVLATRVPQRAGGNYNVVKEGNVAGNSGRDDLTISVLMGVGKLLNDLNEKGVSVNWNQYNTYKMRDNITKQEEIERLAGN